MLLAKGNHSLQTLNIARSREERWKEWLGSKRKGLKMFNDRVEWRDESGGQMRTCKRGSISYFHSIVVISNTLCYIFCTEKQGVESTVFFFFRVSWSNYATSILVPEEGIGRECHRKGCLLLFATVFEESFTLIVKCPFLFLLILFLKSFSIHSVIKTDRKRRFQPQLSFCPCFPSPQLPFHFLTVFTPLFRPQECVLLMS